MYADNRYNIDIYLKPFYLVYHKLLTMCCDVYVSTHITHTYTHTHTLITVPAVVAILL